MEALLTEAMPGAPPNSAAGPDEGALEPEEFDARHRSRGCGHEDTAADRRKKEKPSVRFRVNPNKPQCFWCGFGRMSPRERGRLEAP